MNRRLVLLVFFQRWELADLIAGIRMLVLPLCVQLQIGCDICAEIERRALDKELAVLRDRLSDCPAVECIAISGRVIRNRKRLSVCHGGDITAACSAVQIQLDARVFALPYSGECHTLFYADLSIGAAIHFLDTLVTSPCDKIIAFFRGSRRSCHLACFGHIATIIGLADNDLILRTAVVIERHNGGFGFAADDQVLTACDRCPSFLLTDGSSIHIRCFKICLRSAECNLFRIERC